MGAVNAGRLFVRSLGGVRLPAHCPAQHVTAAIAPIHRPAWSPVIRISLWNRLIRLYVTGVRLIKFPNAQIQDMAFRKSNDEPLHGR